MKKVALSILATTLLTSAMAQVKFKMTRMANNQTYVVSMIPDVTWVSPKNTTLTAQVAIRLAANSHFIAGRITSLVADTRWIDNSYVEKPVGDPNGTYVLFNLQNNGTKAYAYEASTEVPLFTFQNIGTTCFGNIELVDNNAELTKNVIAGGFNVGQSLYTLGADGEAYTGNVGTTQLGCPNVTSAKDLGDTPLSITRAFPTPANEELTIEWQLADAQLNRLKLEVTNNLGEVVHRIGLKPSKTLQTQKLDVKNWAEGMYFLRLISDKGVSRTKTFVVMH